MTLFSFLYYCVFDSVQNCYIYYCRASLERERKKLKQIANGVKRSAIMIGIQMDSRSRFLRLGTIAILSQIILSKSYKAEWSSNPKFLPLAKFYSSFRFLLKHHFL